MLAQPDGYLGKETCLADEGKALGIVCSDSRKALSPAALSGFDRCTVCWVTAGWMDGWMGPDSGGKWD